MNLEIKKAGELCRAAGWTGKDTKKYPHCINNTMFVKFGEKP
jgi:hypothetical protein